MGQGDCVEIAEPIAELKRTCGLSEWAVVLPEKQEGTEEKLLELGSY